MSFSADSNDAVIPVPVTNQVYPHLPVTTTRRPMRINPNVTAAGKLGRSTDDDHCLKGRVRSPGQ